MKFLRIAILVALPGSAFAAQLASALDLNTRGNEASDAGRYEEAIKLYRESLAIWSASGPDYDAHRAGTLFNLGIVISATGNRPEAVRVMGEALAIHRRTLGVRNHRTIANINLLASNYLMIGELERAEALLNEALPIERELYPADIQMARTLEGICNALVRHGKPLEAIEPAEEALAIAIKATGEDSLDTALAYSNVAEAHRSSGHPERALPLFRKARSIYTAKLGPDHPRVAALLSQEGIIMLHDGKISTAEQLMKDSVNSLSRGCPRCAVELAIAEHNLAVLRIQQKRYREADELLTHVVALREGFTSSPGSELASTLQLLATVREKEKLFADAQRLNQRANMILGFR
jgi:tetratricopeptide (TPR) repeat protein